MEMRRRKQQKEALIDASGAFVIRQEGARRREHSYPLLSHGMLGLLSVRCGCQGMREAWTAIWALTAGAQ